MVEVTEGRIFISPADIAYPINSNNCALHLVFHPQLIAPTDLILELLS